MATLTSDHVTLYSTPGCAGCTASKRFLTESGVTFREIDLQEDDLALELVRRLGYQRAPVVVTSAGEHWSGFDPGRLASLAASAAS